jgi:hypothetical protein
VGWIGSDKNGKHGIPESHAGQNGCHPRKNDANTKEKQAKMEGKVESQIGFLVSRMEMDRNTDWEEMKAAIQSVRSELDETIRQ